MKTFVGHRSALRYLRSLDSMVGLHKSASRPQPAEAVSAKDLREALGIEGFEAKRLQLQHDPGAVPVPVDLIIADKDSRRKRSFAVPHVWQTPENCASFLKVNEDLFVSTPEACFVQMTKYLSPVGMAQLGFELCGTYSLNRHTPLGFFKRPALTTRRRLASYLEKLPQHTGFDRAKKALEYVRDNSASPMETCLALLLGLPTSTGGYGLGMPEMNVEVKAPSGNRTSASWRTYHCDLYWRKSKVAVEYNSTLYHTGEDAILRDSERQNDMTAFGINALVVTRPQIASLTRMDVAAEIVAKMMGERFRIRCSDWQVRKMQLRRTLFDPDEFL